MTRTPVSLDDIRSLAADLPGSHAESEAAARARQARLTKPAGSLGRLEEIAVWAAAWQGREIPRTDPVQVLVFAGNHGVAARGVSAFPSEVTGQMVANFEAGGAAINQLCRVAGATLAVHPLELDVPTDDFTEGSAMTAEACAAHVALGMSAVEPGAALLCIGEMGIGNTTVAAALACALLGGDPADWTGRGTGVDDAGLERKTATVAAAIARHGAALSDPLEALRRVGGRELAAMFGSILAARLNRIPVLLDGFVCGAAAAVLARLAGDGLDHCMAAHRSAEAGHRRLLDRLGIEPLLDLGMRLGEASGAAVAACVVRTALEVHAGMATFDQAGVSDRES